MPLRRRRLLYVLVAGEKGRGRGGGRLRAQELTWSITIAPSSGSQHSFLIYDWRSFSFLPQFVPFRFTIFGNTLFSQQDKRFELMTGRHIPLGIGWGSIKDLSSSSSSSSSSRGGLEDSEILMTATPSVLQQSGDVVEVGWEGGREGGEGRREERNGGRLEEIQERN